MPHGITDKDGYIAYMHEFLNEMQRKGKLTEADFNEFNRDRKLKAEAKSIVDDMFKGML